VNPGPAQAVLPEVHHVDAAVGPDAPTTYAEAGTQEDGAIRAGLPCGIPAAVLPAWSRRRRQGIGRPRTAHTDDNVDSVN